jgi:hypothetical protein
MDLTHKYKDNQILYDYINCNISNSLNGLSQFNKNIKPNIENFLFILQFIPDINLTKDLMNYINPLFYKLNQNYQKYNLIIKENILNPSMVNDMINQIGRLEKDLQENITILKLQSEKIVLLEQTNNHIETKIDKIEQKINKIIIKDDS